jgi:TPR repeat protein
MAAKHGRPAGQYFLAGLFRSGGYGLEKNPQFAFELHLELAEAGFTESQLTLAEYYLDGVNEAVPLNFEEGIKWLTIAAELGNEKAQSRLNRMYKK